MWWTSSSLECSGPNLHTSGWGWYHPWSCHVCKKHSKLGLTWQNGFQKNLLWILIDRQIICVRHNGLKICNMFFIANTCEKQFLCCLNIFFSHVTACAPKLIYHSERLHNGLSVGSSPPIIFRWKPEHRPNGKASLISLLYYWYVVEMLLLAAFLHLKRPLDARWWGSHPWLWWQRQTPTRRVTRSCVEDIAPPGIHSHCAAWPMARFLPWTCAWAKVKHHDHDRGKCEPETKYGKKNIAPHLAMTGAWPPQPWWRPNFFSGNDVHMCQRAYCQNPPWPLTTKIDWLKLWHSTEIGVWQFVPSTSNPHHQALHWWNEATGETQFPS